MLPHEAIDKKKRFIKEKRKEIEKLYTFYNEDKNEVEAKEQMRRKKTTLLKTQASPSLEIWSVNLIGEKLDWVSDLI